MFSFPTSTEAKQKWIENIPKINGQLTANKGVCIKHFCESDIKKFDSKVSLIENACPRIFGGVKRRKSLDERQQEKLKAAQEASLKPLLVEPKENLLINSQNVVQKFIW